MKGDESFPNFQNLNQKKRWRNLLQYTKETYTSIPHETIQGKVS